MSVKRSKIWKILYL